MNRPKPGDLYISADEYLSRLVSSLVLSFEPVIGDIFDGMLTLLKDGKVKHVFWTDEEPKVYCKSNENEELPISWVGRGYPHLGESRFYLINGQAPKKSLTPITGWWETDK